MERICIIVGLGNPGREYAETRHNVGFMLLDRLAAHLNSPWKTDRAHKCELASAPGVLLVKPQTYMNSSGESVGPLMRYFKRSPEQVLAVYDDIAFPVGTIKLRAGGSAGGHNGMKSLIAHLGTEKFPRLRIGIGVPTIVDAQAGIVYDATNIASWKEVPLKALLEERFHVPVAVENDCNCFALGESRFGAGRNYTDMVGVTIGTGIGSGIIIDRKLYGGLYRGAGEIGTLPYRDTDFEHYCSSFFFKKKGINASDLAEKARRVSNTGYRPGLSTCLYCER